MRVAHATDIHWMVRPPITRLPGKRLLGSVNLYLMGRRRSFSSRVQQALVDHLVDLRPDAVVITGDLTAQALPAEFAEARRVLDPVLQTIPTFVVPGNHDVYTTGARRSQRIRDTFAPWMGLDGEPIPRLDLEGLTVLGLDPNRPTPLSSGRLPTWQLDGLARALDEPGLGAHPVLLAIHYPVVDRHGQPYDRWDRGLRNVDALIDVIRAAPTRPAAILCGHVHRGYSAELDLGDARIPVLDAGSGGLAYRPDTGRTAAMNLLCLEGNHLAGVERYLWDGERFAREVVGAVGLEPT